MTRQGANPPTREIVGEKAGGFFNERLERTARFDSFVRFLSAKPRRTYQREMGAFAAEVGITETSIRACVKRAKELHILDVVPAASPILGIGRFPNIYELQIDYETWIAEREARIATLLDERRRTKVREASRRKRARQVAKGEANAQLRRQAAAPARVVPGALPIPPPTLALDTAAWAFDADDY